MKFSYLIIVAALLIASLLWIVGDYSARPPAEFHDPVYARLKESGEIKRAKQMPNQWFYMQRAYPHKTIPQERYLDALAQMKALREKSEARQPQDITWTEAGPTNIPGRITDLAVHPLNANIVYVGSAAGGVFKTTDGGASWTAIFDDQGVQSIGALALHPGNPDVIYVGTGEANASGDSYEGTGIYKSTNSGTTWTYQGLPQSYHIGRILIDASNPDSDFIYVAVLGRLFGTNPDRGVYRSADGGNTWQQMLYVDDTTGCVDIAVDTSYHYLYAAMWHRWRSPAERRVGGYESGIYRSTDYGHTWTRLSNGLPVPADTVGRIGLSVESVSHNVYAIYANHPGRFMGVYKSANGGWSWAQINDLALADIYSGFGWYFGNIRVAPGSPNIVYALGVDLFKSTNGGNSWFYADAGIHVDHHAFQFINGSTDMIYDGCDGGVNFTDNGTASWTRLYEMHNTQFYAITIDYSNPQRLYGGTQDNGTMRTLTGDLGDWDRILGGDGFYTVVDYTNPDIIYAEYQWGYLYKSTNGGAEFYWALGDMDYYADRHNWCTPFAIDPIDHNTLYYGSNRLYRTTNAGDNWLAISDDLTNGAGPGNLTYGTITTIAVSPLDNSVIYIGTDDSNVWVTQNGGGSWQNVSATLPNRWVTRVVADPHDVAVAYVTLSGYKESDHLPHIFRTTDYGSSWAAIDGNLPDAPTNDLIVDSDFPATLYIATDFGVFYTRDLGVNWEPLGSGLPLSPVHDLAFHPPTRKLVAGTHGRSMYQTTVEFTDYYCGDVDGDSLVNYNDVIYLGNYIFHNGLSPVVDTIADVDKCGSINVSDIAYLCEYLYLGGSQPCSSAVDCYQPAGSNQISLGCPVEVRLGGSDSAALPIYLTNDTPIRAFSLGFYYNSNDIEITSVDLTNSILPDSSFFHQLLSPIQNQVLIGYADSCGAASIPVQTGGLLARLWVQVLPGASSRTVDIDSVFVAPAGEFILSAAGGGSIVPTFSDCDTADIIIYLCGDADSNDLVNIADVVYLISYVFGGGPAPQPLSAGDADCDGLVNIADVVYLIAYIFGGGSEPCAHCP